MKKPLILIPLALTLLILRGSAESMPTEPGSVTGGPRDTLSEVSGVLRQPGKNCKPYVLELDGTMQQLELEGDALKLVPPGSHIKVRGTLRAELHEAQAELAAMVTHWHIYMAAREVETLPAAPQGDAKRPSMRSDERIPVGRLSHHLGAYLKIEGVRVEGIKTGERILLVDTVNGKKLDKSIEVAVENLESLPKGGRCILRGYETGQMIGTPPALEQAAKEEGRDIPLPQAGWEFRRYFMVISVVEPKDLARLGNDKEPNNQVPDDGRITAEQAKQIGVEWMQKEYGNDAEQRTHAPYDVRDSGDHWLIIGSSVDGTLDGLWVTVNKKTREVKLRTDRGTPDAICDMLFQNYIVRGGKINTSTIMAASHIIAERGRETDYWKIVLEKLRSIDEGSEIGCVRILGKMLATDARARDIIRTGELTAWDASVRLPPEVVEELVARGKKADRFRVDHYGIALARARVPEAQDFFHLILRDDTGKSYMPTARFFSAVGLAHLGNPAGFEWLIANCEDSLPTISNAWPAGVPNLNVDTCCVAALKSLTGTPNLNTKAQWEAWWKNADRKAFPKGDVGIVDP